MTENELLAFQIFRGSVKARDFGAFIINMINSNQYLKDKVDDIVLFCDNASIHKGKVLNELFSKIEVVYNVPYCPFLNPIEELFGRWKHYFRKRSHFDLEFMTRDIINSALTLKNYLYPAFVYHVHKYYINCIHKEKIE